MYVSGGLYLPFLKYWGSLKFSVVSRLSVCFFVFVPLFYVLNITDKITFVNNKNKNLKINILYTANNTIKIELSENNTENEIATISA